MSKSEIGNPQSAMKSDMMLGPMDWFKASIHIQNVSAECVDGGSRGVQYLSETVRPLKERLEAGERSEKLYRSIMELNYE